MSKTGKPRQCDSDSDIIEIKSSSDEEVTVVEEWEVIVKYTCNRCPGKQFTAKERERHKRWHNRQKRLRKSRSRTKSPNPINFANNTEQNSSATKDTDEDGEFEKYDWRCKKCPGALFTKEGMTHHRKLHEQASSPPENRNGQNGKKNEVDLDEVSSSEDNESASSVASQDTSLFNSSSYSSDSDSEDEEVPLRNSNCKRRSTRLRNKSSKKSVKIASRQRTGRDFLLL